MSPRTRGRITKAGWASVLTGVLFGLIGLLGTPVAAQDHQVTICHATGSATNPYVATHPSKWQIVAANGHGTHPGDIVPAFGPGSQGAHVWAGYPGQNLHLLPILSAGCVAAGTTTTSTSTTTTSTTSTTTTTTLGPSGPVGQVGAPAAGPTAPDVVEPGGGTTPPTVAGVQVSRTPAAAPGQAAAEALPRTGSSTERLTEVGLGLILLGFGLLLSGRPLPELA